MRATELKNNGSLHILSPHEHQLLNMIEQVKSFDLFVLDLLNATFAAEVKQRNISLIFCRHMMRHLTTNNNLIAIRNIQHSGAKYFMATTSLFQSINGSTFDHEQQSTYQLAMGRNVFLMEFPYCLVPPLYLFQESITKSQPDSSSYMGLWEISGDENGFTRPDCVGQQSHF